MSPLVRDRGTPSPRFLCSEPSSLLPPATGGPPTGESVDIPWKFPWVSGVTFFLRVSYKILEIQPEQCVCEREGRWGRERQRQRDGETERDMERWSERGELTGLALSGTGECRLRGQAELPSLLAADAQGPIPAALQGPPRCAPVGAPAPVLSGRPPPSDARQAPSVCSWGTARGWLRTGRCLNLRDPELRFCRFCT